MMKLEFIQLTGFEPTAEEYRQIEDEYMACDIDKKDFCKNWCKEGGPRRLMRLRAAKIEELERKLAKAAETEQDLHNEYDKLVDKYQARTKELEEELDRLKGDVDSMQEELERKSDAIVRFREAFSALVEA